MNAVFLGDSWCDDGWNGHKTWATMTAENNEWRHVNLSKAGYCADDVMRVLENTRVSDVTPETKWILHVGGNDLLYWVLANPLLVLFEAFSNDKGRFRRKSAEIARKVSDIVRHIRDTYGCSDVTVCSNTACYDLPLCRLIGLVYAPFSTKKHMDQISRVTKEEMLYANPDVSFFDESSVLSKLSWKWDLYHPSENSHATIAEKFCEKMCECEPSQSAKNTTK